jgi:hypothetical protein
MMEELMNGRDVADVVEILRDQRMAMNRSVQKYQRKLVARVRTQLVDRAPTASSLSNAREQHTEFARWLEARKTLEGTYLSESEGGQPRVRTLQMTAESVRDLRSEELRQVLPGKYEYFLEPHTWVLRELERQLNHWRHVSMDDLPWWIHVDFAPLVVEPDYENAVRPYGTTTLTFTVTGNPNQLL